MPSPFPGMNPYLEHPRIWEDFHQTFMVLMRSVIAPQVIPQYFVRVRERVVLHKPDKEECAFLPTKVTLSEVVKMRVAYLEVTQSDDERVVTTIELLSRSNKTPGEDRESYLTKRKELLVSGVNFVELDLLRTRPRMPLPGLQDCDYYALVFRPAQKPKADVWPLQLRDELPTIPIPLLPRDHEAQLDLKAVLDRFHDESGLEHDIYRRKPDPPLSAEDTAWAKGFIPRKLTTPR